MAVTTTQTNKPINPRGNDQSPKGYNRASLYSGKALDFDGVNDSVSVADSNDLDGFTNFTICAIIKADTLPNYCRIITKGSGVYYVGVQYPGNGELEFYANGTRFFSEFVLNTGEYVHFAISFTGGQDVKFYQNGQLKSTQTHSISGTGTNSNNVVIGRNVTLNGNPWDGHISNVKIFNTALTAAQVADLYNNPEKVVPTGVDNTALKLWLPMQEGAGTTAYDGSGNGNHGTISGATWTHGIGAPVSQTAVIDWNKGTNEFPESNGFVETDSNYSYSNSSETEATITAPDGSTNAFEYICDAVTTSNQFFRINPNTTYTSGQVYTYSLFVKYNTKQFVKLSYMNYATSEYFAAAFDLVNGLVTDTNVQGLPTNTSSFIEEAPNGWYRIGISAAMTSSSGQSMNFEFNVLPSGTPTWSTYGRVDQTTTTNDKVYIYGASLIEGAKGVYIPTFGTAQTSPVLLPQGLTSGRDITGVNLFENVRKQGALNLDGNSWAEVHDNASLDIGDFTMETWVKFNELTGTYQVIFAKDDSNGDRSFELYLEPTEDKFGATIFDANNAQFNASTINTTDWIHIVSTFNDTTNAWNGYVNGALNKTATIAVSQNNTENPLIIGAWYTKTQFNVSGQIAQPRIYNRALTAEEVERNYNAGKNIYQ